MPSSPGEPLSPSLNTLSAESISQQKRKDILQDMEPPIGLPMGESPVPLTAAR